MSFVRRAGSFLDLVFTPRLAAEVTLQPVRRFGFDAAILFSDILVIPHALGRTVTFEVGEGPRLEPISGPEALDLLRPEVDQAVLAPVYETIRLVTRAQPPVAALLGFCGAPWTVATYMIAGRGTPDQAPARLFAYAYPDDFGRLINLLVEASTAYLVRQFEAGVDAVQIFDTWAGVLSPSEFTRWCVEPVQQVGGRGKEPSAGCPRSSDFHAAPAALLADYAARIPLDAVGLDWMIDPDLRARTSGAEPSGTGQSRSLGAARRRRCSRSWCRRRAGGIRRPAADLQSRSWHSSGNTDCPCEANASRVRRQ